MTGSAVRRAGERSAAGGERTGFRFRPPRVSVPPEIDWLLAMAFGSPGLSQLEPPTPDPTRVVRSGETLGLLPRIRTRRGRDRLDAWLGPAAARADDARWRVAARLVALRRCVEDLAVTASDLGVPIVLLKGTALDFAGVAVPGARGIGDIDLLVPEEGATRLRAALCEQGYPSSGAASAQHLAPVTHPIGIPIEIHRRIVGLRLTPDRDVDATECLERRHGVGVPSLPGRVHVPDRDFLLAHCLIHGLASHGFTPDTYPPWRMLADLQDLGLTGPPGESFWRTAFEWIGWAVSREEVEAAQGLLSRLESDEPASAIAAGDDGPARLLRHVLAGLDLPDYIRWLDLQQQLGGEQGTGARQGRELTRRAWIVLWPSRQWLDETYGPVRGPGARVWRRLTHPAAVAVRFARAGLSAVRLRSAR